MSIPPETKLGNVSLGHSRRCFSLRHGIKVPIDPAIVRLVVSYRIPDSEAEHEARYAGYPVGLPPLEDPRDRWYSGLTDSDPAHWSATGRRWVFCVSYPAEFHVATTVLDVDGSGGGVSSWVNLDLGDQVLDAEALRSVALDCFYAEAHDPPWFYDEVFPRFADEVGEEEERKFWDRHKANATPAPDLVVGPPPAPELVVGTDDDGPYAAFGTNKIHFDDRDRMAHRFLAVLAGVPEDGSIEAAAVVKELNARTAPEQAPRWAQNLCAVIRNTIPKLGLGREPAASTVTGKVTWKKLQV